MMCSIRKGIMEQEREEGEMSDDTEMIVDDEQLSHELLDNQNILFYKADKEGLIVEQLNKIDASKIEDRAKRFGLNLTGNKLVTQNQIDELYSNFGIESGNERHFRFDTLHLNGVGGLTTKEIFAYLKDYKPVSLEWVDANSCNIVCQDHISVALALLVHSQEITNDDVKKMLFEKSSYHWREGMPHSKSDTILMRFATNSDKKVNHKIPEQKIKDTQNFESGNNTSKNPWGDLCRSWGVYDHQEIFQRKLTKTDYEDESEEPTETLQLKNKKLAMRLGKRSYKIEDEEESSDSDSEWKKKTKTPRMRMHADDEESKQVKHNSIYHNKDEENDNYAPLSIEVINSRSTFIPKETKIVSDKFKYKERPAKSSHKNIQSRLGVKVVQDKSYSNDAIPSNGLDNNIISRVQKVNSSSKNVSVWSRLEVNTAKATQQSDLRQILTTRKQKSDDLRGKLSKSKQCNLRIEIDNNYVNE
ncbi:nuclear cap-binding protein subunit 3-like [Nymphalis io]|uniref:nuclear cap-binding protein subunit 3-like n=1 Tax=Inachis io TaxID=171585 RepID=UPI002168D155|nr:nuclear cap-binding protein subunit 3-like [Nymphalis io]